MTNPELFARVREARDAIFESLKHSKEQPQDAVLDRVECLRKSCPTGFYHGKCYVVAVEPRGLGTDFFRVDINLAGLRVAEGICRLATDEEIIAYKAAQ
jgi:hypothetical protein